MRKPRFERLQTLLLDRGISPSYAQRLVAELNDHYDDLQAERGVTECTSAAFSSATRRRLGSDIAIAAQVLGRPELRGRCSRVRAALRVACVSAESLSFGLDDGAAVARWGASISLGALMTVAILFALARTLSIGL